MKKIKEEAITAVIQKLEHEKTVINYALFDNKEKFRGLISDERMAK